MNFILFVLLALRLQADAFSINHNNDVHQDSRRTFFTKMSKTVPASLLVGGAIVTNNPLVAVAAPSPLVEDLQVSVKKMESIPDLLDQGEWDKVRTILKTPPINKLWNLGEVRTHNSL